MNPDEFKKQIIDKIEVTTKLALSAKGEDKGYLQGQISALKHILNNAYLPIEQLVQELMRMKKDAIYLKTHAVSKYEKSYQAGVGETVKEILKTPYCKERKEVYVV